MYIPESLLLLEDELLLDDPELLSLSLLLLLLPDSESEEESESESEEDEEEEEESDDSTSCRCVIIIFGAFFKCSRNSSLYWEKKVSHLIRNIDKIQHEQKKKKKFIHTLVLQDQ